MIAKQFQILIADDLRDAVIRHAQALVAGDLAGAEAWVDLGLIEDYRAAAQPAAAMRPFSSFDLIARARLGFQYLIKVRFLDAGGNSLTLQVRWRQQDGTWRIAEVQNLNLASPWHRPAQTAASRAQASMVKVHG